jgi:hypothetical protein
MKRVPVDPESAGRRTDRSAPEFYLQAQSVWFFTSQLNPSD